MVAAPRLLNLLQWHTHLTPTFLASSIRYKTWLSHVTLEYCVAMALSTCYGFCSFYCCSAMFQYTGFVVAIHRVSQKNFTFIVQIFLCYNSHILYTVLLMVYTEEVDWPSLIVNDMRSKCFPMASMHQWHWHQSNLILSSIRTGRQSGLCHIQPRVGGDFHAMNRDWFMVIMTVIKECTFQPCDVSVYFTQCWC